MPSLNFRPHPLAVIGQQIIGKTGNEGVSLRFQRFRQHAPRSYTGNLSQWVAKGIQLAKFNDGAIFLHGVSILL
jgi:hypothetical protein